MVEYLDNYKSTFNEILAIKPTGWAFSGKTDLNKVKPLSKSGKITIYGLPYSEHSSYNELMYFIAIVASNNPKIKVIFTVSSPTDKYIEMKLTINEWILNRYKIIKEFSLLS